MRILVPTPVTDAVLVASSIAEDDYPEWDGATAYAAGARAMRASLHRCYERLAAGTSTTAPEDDPATWVDLGATNRWRAFDEKVGTVSSALETLSFTLAPGLVNGLALIGLNAASVRVTVEDPVEGTVYDRTESLYDPTGINTWYAWFFEPIRRKTQLVLDDLPSYGRAQVTVTLSAAAGAEVSLGALLVGRVRRFAPAARFGATLGIQDYSRKDRDAWGNSYVVERAYARRARWSVWIERRDVDALQAFLAGLRATPAVYIGSDWYESAVVYGFYRQFDVVISYPQLAECEIEIEGLV